MELGLPIYQEMSYESFPNTQYLATELREHAKVRVKHWII